jgi:hypothetical protein
MPNLFNKNDILEAYSEASQRYLKINPPPIQSQQQQQQIVMNPLPLTQQHVIGSEEIQRRQQLQQQRQQQQKRQQENDAKRNKQLSDAASNAAGKAKSAVKFATDPIVDMGNNLKNTIKADVKEQLALKKEQAKAKRAEKEKDRQQRLEEKNNIERVKREENEEDRKNERKRRQRIQELKMKELEEKDELVKEGAVVRDKFDEEVGVSKQIKMESENNKKREKIETEREEIEKKREIDDKKLLEVEKKHDQDSIKIQHEIAREKQESTKYNNLVRLEKDGFRVPIKIKDESDLLDIIRQINLIGMQMCMYENICNNYTDGLYKILKQKNNTEVDIQNEINNNKTEFIVKLNRNLSYIGNLENNLEEAIKHILKEYNDDRKKIKIYFQQDREKGSITYIYWIIYNKIQNLFSKLEHSEYLRTQLYKIVSKVDYNTLNIIMNDDDNKTLILDRMANIRANNLTKGELLNLYNSNRENIYNNFKDYISKLYLELEQHGGGVRQDNLALQGIGGAFGAKKVGKADINKENYITCINNSLIALNLNNINEIQIYFLKDSQIKIDIGKPTNVKKCIITRDKISKLQPTNNLLDLLYKLQLKKLGQNKIGDFAYSDQSNTKIILFIQPLNGSRLTNGGFSTTNCDTSGEKNIIYIYNNKVEKQIECEDFKFNTSIVTVPQQQQQQQHNGSQPYESYTTSPEIKQVDGRDKDKSLFKRPSLPSFKNKAKAQKEIKQQHIHGSELPTHQPSSSRLPKLSIPSRLRAALPSGKTEAEIEAKKAQKAQKAKEAKEVKEAKEAAKERKKQKLLQQYQQVLMQHRLQKQRNLEHQFLS